MQCKFYNLFDILSSKQDTSVTKSLYTCSFTHFLVCLASVRTCSCVQSLCTHCLMQYSLAGCVVTICRHTLHSHPCFCNPLRLCSLINSSTCSNRAGSFLIRKVIERLDPEQECQEDRLKSVYFWSLGALRAECWIIVRVQVCFMLHNSYL